MKNKILIPVIILLALGAFFSFRYIQTQNSGQNKDEDETILQTSMALIQSGHFSPRPLNDSFSHMIFDKTINRLDGEKKFFTQEDYDNLRKKYRNDIDDEIKKGSLAFFHAVNDLFVKRVDEASNFYSKILNTPFHFNKADSLQMNDSKRKYAANETALKERWRKYLKYRVLSKYAALKKQDMKKAKDSADYHVRPFDSLEKQARQKVAKIQKRYFKRLKKLSDYDRFSLYMNAITNAEDPHSNYFPLKRKKRFDEIMSGSFFGIGAALQQKEDGTIKITQIITGSPAWKQGTLKAKDVILKVGQGDKPPVDIEGMDLEKVVKIIRGPKGTVVKLTVRHHDGTKEVIPITRGKVELDYLFAKSAILKEQGKKIGYIYLPEFYADFNGVSHRRSATDVKKEVQKLKAENVDGIILDLRNNGGGSLADVVNMAGIFVGSGPVVQVKTRGDNIRALKNHDGTPIFNKPLAIMVNGNSASASEIMTAAMQDYKRAIIIGSRTYGKGTVQKLVPLGRFISSSLKDKIVRALNEATGNDEDYKGIGSLKLTIQKFYRINGGSTQRKGITPDIILPNVHQYIDHGERSEESALPWDKIPSAQYNTWQNPPPYTYLEKRSKLRTDSNHVFNLIKKMALELKKHKEHNFAPLSYKIYEQKQEKRKERNKKINQLDSISNGLTVVNVKANLSKIQRDSSSIAKNKHWLKTLGKDVSLTEAAKVINDWINYNNGTAKAKEN